MKSVLAWTMAAAFAAFGSGCAATAPDDEPVDSTEQHAVISAGDKVLNFRYEVQETGFWCGPAATKMVLSARMSNPPSQGALAQQLPTDQQGTDWIGQVTRTLNRNLGGSWYKTREMPNDPPTQAQSDALWRDIVYNIDHGYGIVANIVAPPNNHPPGYPNYTVYHYFAVMGYNATTQKVFIADSANFGGYKKYWLTFRQLATLIPPKGYSAAFAPPPGPPTPAPTLPEGCKTISPGEGLSQGQAFESCDHRFRLALQTDGNLVLYKNGNGGAALWATGTTAGFAAVMQPDGNFVLYGKQSDALWASGTHGHPGSYLDIQDDGNVVVYERPPAALWATHTHGH